MLSKGYIRKLGGQKNFSVSSLVDSSSNKILNNKRNRQNLLHLEEFPPCIYLPRSLCTQMIQIWKTSWNGCHGNPLNAKKSWLWWCWTLGLTWGTLINSADSTLTVADCHSCFKFQSHHFKLFFILTNFKYNELSTLHVCSLWWLIFLVYFIGLRKPKRGHERDWLE